MVYIMISEVSVALPESAEDSESFGGRGWALRRFDIWRVGFSVLTPIGGLVFPGRR